MFVFVAMRAGDCKGAEPIIVRFKAPIRTKRQPKLAYCLSLLIFEEVDILSSTLGLEDQNARNS